MKNLLIFLFGAAFGVGGTLLWLRKDIEKELDNIRIHSKNEDDIPFTVGDNTKNKNKNEKDDMNKYIPEEDRPEALKEENRIQYNKIIEENYDLDDEDVGDVEASFSDTSEGIFEIDEDDFMHDHSNEKERLVYYRGDCIMSTENGTIIKNPFPLVGENWEQFVGNYADRTAFIRNPKLVTDYEIYVEDGLYSDEFGDEENFRED